MANIACIGYIKCLACSVNYVFPQCNKNADMLIVSYNNLLAVP